MPKVKETPKHLAAYQFHGVDLDEGNNGQAIGDCPFCGKEIKFSVKVETGQYKCWVCGETGNTLTFLRTLWDRSELPYDKETTKLSSNRTLTDPKTLEVWGVRRCMISGDWIVPGWNADGKLVQLYKYTGRPKRMLATKGMAHGLFGRHLWVKKKTQVWITEGPWDAMALWETLRCTKEGDGGLELTANEELSLFDDINIIAVPGATTFLESWYPLLSGKSITLLYDNDHPRENNGKIVKTGYDSMQRVAMLLAKSTDGQPASLSFLDWGKGEGYDKGLPNGYDVRDWLAGKDQHATD